MTSPRELPENRPFFDGLREGRLLVQACDRCGHRQLGSAVCRGCGGAELRWVETGGRGTVRAVTTVRRGPSADVAVPYVLAIVELDDGPWLVARLESDPLDPLGGGRVEARFGERRGDAVVPSFAPVASGGAA